jgi:hypothetical protein
MGNSLWMAHLTEKETQMEKRFQKVRLTETESLMGRKLLEIDGSWESVGAAEGLFDLYVGLKLEDGRFEGDRDGEVEGESVGVADGLRDFEGEGVG